MEVEASASSQAWRLAGPERNLETEDHLRLPWVLSGLDLIGSQSCPISRRSPSFLTWIRGSQCCARSQLGGEACCWANRRQEEGSRSGKVEAGTTGEAVGLMPGTGSSGSQVPGP